ncbi:WYL domain-containing protein [Salibacterium sp. K-3]
MEGVLKRAAETKEPVQVIYESRDGTLSQRTVTVHQFNEKHVLVWCHHRRAIRSLKVSNILSAGRIKQYA